MSTVEHLEPTTIPPLGPGQRLDQPTFRRRYEAMPPGTRAELIDGVVSMPPLLGSDHGDSNLPVAFWLGCYQRATPGVQGTINTSTVLNDRNEVQPDCSLRILAEHGGATTTISGWIEGAPELVVEIARSSRSIDLGPKLEEYRKAGVREYVVVALAPDEVLWHDRRGEQFVQATPGADGIYRSRAFPGLWLEPSALFQGDLARLMAVVDLGLASPEHADFVEGLARRRAGG